MDLTKMIGFGVAGNFAGHLEQAGEASDFVNVKVKDAIQPKAIFPFYVPHIENSFLNVFPISHHQIQFPDGADNLQIEPEVCLILRRLKRPLTVLVQHKPTVQTGLSLNAGQTRTEMLKPTH